jgi:hypothetical protein
MLGHNGPFCDGRHITPRLTRLHYPSITGAPRSMDENNHVEPFGARKPMHPFDRCSCGGHGKHRAPAALAASEVENR